MKKLSIVIPLYNESESLVELHGKILETIDTMEMDCEILFVDDGSTDNSYEVLSKIWKQDTQVTVIRLKTNSGKSAALQAGFDNAGGDYIITIDADLQDPLSKTLPSKVFNMVVRFFGGIKLHDFNCGLKGYRREVIESFRIYGELHRYIPVMAKFHGFRVGEIVVRHHPRKHGRSKYGARRFVAGFLDLMTVILLTRYTTKPLHLFGSIGLIFSFFGGLVNLYIVKLWVESGFKNIQGRQPLLVGGVFLFLLGIQFISTGLLAELITHSRMEQGKTYRIDPASRL